MEGALRSRIVTAPVAWALLPVRRLLRCERGTAVVEFAIVAPMLIALVIGAIDFSRALNYYNNLTQLAAQGARAASVNRNPDGSAVGTAPSPCNAPALANYSIQCETAKIYPTTNELKNGITVCIPSLPAGAGQPVTVRASFNFKFFTLPLGLRLGTVTLSASSTQMSNAASVTYSAGDQDGHSC